MHSNYFLGVERPKDGALLSVIGIGIGSTPFIGIRWVYLITGYTNTDNWHQYSPISNSCILMKIQNTVFSHFKTVFSAYYCPPIIL